MQRRFRLRQRASSKQVVHVHVAVAVNVNVKVHEQVERDGQLASHPDSWEPHSRLGAVLERTGDTVYALPFSFRESRAR